MRTWALRPELENCTHTTSAACPGRAVDIAGGVEDEAGDGL
jgi:hypothetical protein